MTNFKFLQTIIILAVITLTASLIYFIESAIDNYDQVNDSWSHYNDTETQIVESLLILNARLGYGGMIHHFKNFVIRGDLKYLTLFQRDTSEIRKRLASIEILYEQSHDLVRLDLLLSEIKTTVLKYEQQLAVARQMHAAHNSIENIDSLVKVDDEFAVRALTVLRDEIVQRSIVMRRETNLALSQSHDTLSNGRFFSVPILLLMVLLVYYIRRVQSSNDEVIKSREWVNTLLDTAPEATISSNKNGDIIRANQQAEKLFGYDQQELLNMNIEQLVPQRFSESHVSKREDYFANQQIRPMNKSLGLFALLKNGDEIEVSISLSMAGAAKNRTAISMIRDVTEVRQASRQLAHEASHDALTGLINRVEVEKAFAKEIDRANRYNRSLSVFMVDIDHFKNFNDSYGHSTGDLVLKAFADNLNAIMRKSDFNARFGGEEFVVILPETTSSDAAKLAERLRQSIQKIVIEEKDSKLAVTASIGVANFPDNGNNFEDILKQADTALYKAKELGRNRIQIA